MSAVNDEFRTRLLRSLNLLVLYIAAAVCLPEVRDGADEVNMYAYYDRARRVSFGALAIGLVFFSIYNWTGEEAFHWLDSVSAVSLKPYMPNVLT